MKGMLHTPKEPNAFAAGAEAQRKGKDVHQANPYVKGSHPYIRFVRGYQSAQTDAVNARPLDAWAIAQEATK